MAQVIWQVKRFEELTINELYDLLKLRIDVFVVEQTCYYPDLDDLDRQNDVYHVLGFIGDEMVAYSRLLPPNLVYLNESAIGRVIIKENSRKLKLGYKLMEESLRLVDELWPKYSCHISAQEHLKAFYRNCGFEQISEMYLEDDIPHIAMCREAKL